MQHSQLQQEFTQVYDTHVDQIAAFLMARLDDRERAKELLQETFMRAWRYVCEGHTIEDARPFLYTTAHNLLKNEIRDRREQVSLDTLMDHGFVPIHAEPSSLEEQLDARRLLAHIQKLSPLYREILTLRFIENLSIREITQTLRLPSVTVSTRIHRGLKRLRSISSMS